MEIEGIIIRQTPFQDNDMMVTVLTNEKLFSFLARGVMKIDSKNASSVNLFTYGQYNLMSGKKGKTLKNSVIINPYSNIRKDFDKLVLLNFISEITFKTISDDNLYLIYPYLKKILEIVNDGYDTLSALLIYLATCLKIGGYGLNVDECIICHKTSPIIAVDYQNGGFICADCFDSSKHLKFCSRKLKIIRYIFKVKPEMIGNVSFKKEETIEIILELKDFIQRIADIHLKSLSLIRNI